MTSIDGCRRCGSRVALLAVILAVILATLPGCGDDEGGSATAGRDPGTGGGGADGTGGGGGSGGDGIDLGARAFRSGERLRAEVLDGGEGAVVFLGFIDNELDVSCDFAEGPDGVARCMPQGDAVVFADGGCTDPVVAAPPCGEVARYAYDFEGDGCAAAMTLYRVGAARPSVDEVFGRVQGSCVSLGAPSAEVHATEPFDVATLVSAELTRDDVDAGLARELWIASDGAALVVGAFDTVLSAPCDPTRLVDRCLPSRAYSGDGYPYFGDDTCSLSVAWQPTTCAAPHDPEIIEELRPKECGYESVFYEVGARVDDPHRLDGDACAEAPAERLFVAGAEADLSRFPSVELRSLGAGEVAVETFVAGDAALTRNAQFVGCAPLELDGELRCIPPGIGQTAYFFADAACTEPLSLAPPSCDASELALIYDDAADCGVGVLREVRPLGAAHGGAVFFTTDAGCVDAGGASQDLVTLGSPIDPGNFAPITRRVE